MNKKLLVDVRPFEISRQKIDESIKENDGRLVVKGVLQRAESKNQNGRVYPREVLLKEVSKYLDEQVSERRALGELDHPESSVVNLNNASHNVIEMHWDGDDLMGTVEVLSTPAGLSYNPAYDASVDVQETHLQAWRDVGFSNVMQWWGATAQFMLVFLNYRS